MHLASREDGQHMREVRPGAVSLTSLPEQLIGSRPDSPALGVGRGPSSPLGSLCSAMTGVPR